VAAGRTLGKGKGVVTVHSMQWGGSGLVFEDSTVKAVLKPAPQPRFSHNSVSVGHSGLEIMEFTTHFAYA
jgi:hypothetical protein